MFNFFKRKNSFEPTFTLERTEDGKFAIVDSSATAYVGVYTRKRDAIRGAQRKGLTLANA